jgi:hypothetical protein
VKHFVRGGWVVLSLLAFALLLKASIPQVPTGTWQAGNSLNTARSDTSAVLLPDGRILIAGGTDANGVVLVSAEIVNVDGSISLTAPMNVPRTSAAAIVLPTGNVLVTGGITTDGGITNSAELYDPLNNSWEILPAAMAAPRSGHTMSQLLNGEVLIAGGNSSSGPVAALEIFDPANQSFTQVGMLVTARKDHAAAVLPDGRVFIAGGTNASGATLASTEIFDSNGIGTSAGPVSPGPALNAGRAKASVTTLLDGTVLIAGGNTRATDPAQGVVDLASAEIFDPAANAIAPSASSLTTARSRHLAILLPNNNSVLIVGGNSAGNTLASVETYTPWTKQFSAVSSMSGARAGASGAALSSVDGLLQVLGGKSANDRALAGSEYYGFATVKTDQSDYAPGMPVTITGSGWQPGETVMLNLVESPNLDTHPPLTAIADASGNIFNNQFSPDTHDLNVRFYLTAVGASSQAQNTFTDGQPIITTVASSPFSPNQSSSAGVNDTTDITGKNQGGGAIADFRIRIRAGSTSGTLVREFLCGSLGSNASCTKTWDGKDSASNFLADGTYVAIGSSGTSENTAANDVATIVVDSTNPTVTLTSPANLAFVHGPVDLEANPGDANGIQKVEFYVDGTGAGSLVGVDTSAGGGGWKVTNIALSDGDHTWSAKAFDNAGNNVFSSSRTIHVDSTNPNVSINSVPNGSVGTSMTITGTASDLPALVGYGVASVQVTISGPAGTTGAATNTGTNFSTWSFTFTPSAPGSYSAQAMATDQAGNSSNSNTRNFTVVADSTAPATTISLGPATPNGSNGWYTSNVGVTVSATDNAGGTGVAETRCVLDPASAPATFDDIPAVCAYTGSGANIADDGQHVIYAASKDNNGNKETVKSASFKIDKTAPGITFTSRTLANANGWNNSAVTVNWSCSDATSGAVSASASQTVSTQGQNQSSTGTCSDNAGNTATDTQNGINIDTTAPTIAFDHQTPTANGNGWNNTNVQLIWNCSDALSGAVDDTVSQSLSTEGFNQSATGTCTDKAGNTATNTKAAINIDKTAPTLSGSPSPAANINGWNNTDVTVTFACSDALSGVDTAPFSPQTVNTEGAGQSRTANCMDEAGNSASAMVNNINIDKTAPTASASASPGPNAYGWNNTDVTVTFSGIDSLSGIDSCTSPATLSSDGANQSASGTCTDKAGNPSVIATASGINIDKTPPVISFTGPNPLPNSYGWNNTNVTLFWNCADSLSGPVASPVSQLISTEGSSQSAVGACFDKAGNSTTHSDGSVNIDKTSPTLSPTVSPSTVLLNGSATATPNAADALSGIASQSCPAVNTSGVGLHSLTCTATDKAGNANTAVASYTVQFGVCPLFDYTRSVKSGATYPIKFYLCDVNHADYSSSSTIAHAVTVSMVSGYSGVPEDAGNANPDLDFRFDPTLGPGGGYIFNLKTTGLAGGTYLLNFNVSDDPTAHAVQFGVK